MFSTNVPDEAAADKDFSRDGMEVFLADVLVVDKLRMASGGRERLALLSLKYGACGCAGCLLSLWFLSSVVARKWDLRGLILFTVCVCDGIVRRDI